jgi:hypothetical protein
LLAEKVETVEEFRLCLELGFEYFQGYYFARPAILSGKKISPSELVVLRLLELIGSNADNAAIEAAVKRDALLSLNLLRLVNSRAAGPDRHIESVSQALNQLGRSQLQRWLQILLYSTPDGRVELNSPLLQMATTRGRLLELMSQTLHPGDTASAETAFTIGMMSLMDALLSIPMANILDRVDVALRSEGRAAGPRRRLRRHAERGRGARRQAVRAQPGAALSTGWACRSSRSARSSWPPSTGCAAWAPTRSRTDPLRADPYCARNRNTVGFLWKSGPLSAASAAFHLAAVRVRTDSVGSDKSVATQIKVPGWQAPARASSMAPLR